MTDPLIGMQVGGHVVHRQIGQGGMGTVYEMRHPHIGKRLALKVLNAEYAARPDIVDRFFKEAHSATLVNHPNIIDVVDLATLPDGRPYILMEFLTGNSLSEEIRDVGQLDMGLVQLILLDLCSALEAAHQKGIIHRDLKPANIQFDNLQGGGRIIKVLDFGIAKLQMETKRQTRTGSVIGTPRYMSPEQAMGKTKQIDHRTDVYALGVIAYQMITGVVPFDGETFGELLMQHSNEPPPPLSIHRKDVSPVWEVIVRRALAKDKDDRYPSMRAFSEAVRDATVEKYVGGAPDDSTITMPSAIGGISTPPTRSDVPPRPKRETMRDKSRPYIVAAAILSVIGGGGLVWSMSRTTDSAAPSPEVKTVVSSEARVSSSSSTASVSSVSSQPAVVVSSVASVASSSKSAPKSSSTSKRSSSRRSSSRPNVSVKLCARPWGYGSVAGRNLGEMTCRDVQLREGGSYTFRARNGTKTRSKRFRARRGATYTITF